MFIGFEHEPNGPRFARADRLRRSKGTIAQPLSRTLRAEPRAFGDVGIIVERTADSAFREAEFGRHVSDSHTPPNSSQGLLCNRH